MKKFLFILLIIIVAVALTKNTLIKLGVEKGVEAVTGLPLQIEKFEFGILDTRVDIQGMQLSNPKEYQDKSMADIPQIYVDYNIADLLKGKVHLEDVRLNLKEFVVVKDKNGKININSLKVASQPAPAKEKPKEAAKTPDIQIDNLEFKFVGKVIYKDYTKGDSPSVREFKMNIDEKFQNITDPNALVRMIVIKTLAKTSIATLVDFDTWGNAVGGTVEMTKGAMTKTAETAGAAVSKTAETAEEAAKTTVNALKDATGNITGILSSPFSSGQQADVE